MFAETYCTPMLTDHGSVVDMTRVSKGGTVESGGLGNRGSTTAGEANQESASELTSPKD